jgi:hypothetical protein
MKATGVWTLAVLCALPTIAAAEIIDFTIPLSGAEEVPPVETTGTGDVSIQLDTVTGAIILGGSFDQLMSPATTAALIGFAPVGSIGTIELITLAIVPVDDSRTAGDLSGSGTLTPEQVQGLLEQQTYINVRSSEFPNGELRGQVVPSPATLLTLGSLGLVRRRNRFRGVA